MEKDEKEAGEANRVTVDAVVAYSSLSAIIDEILSASKKIMITELDKLLKQKNLGKAMEKGIMSYIYAAGFLSFAGREINKENLTKAMRAIGAQSDPRMIDALLKTGIKSHVIYVYAFYFLVANGKEASEENVRKVVEEFGISEDSKTLEETLAYINREI